MSEYGRISTRVYVLHTEPKYIFATKTQAKAKHKEMGYPAYKAPVTTHVFDTKQQMINFICGQQDE